MSTCATDVLSLPAERAALKSTGVAAAALAALLLAACGTQTQSRPPVFNLSGFSAAYKQGHADGCAQQGRDERKYREENDYMMGWNDGRSACKKTQR